MNFEITEKNYQTYSKKELFEKIKELQFELSGERSQREKIQDYIESIIDNSPTAMMIIDAPDGNISYINDAVWDFRGETDAKMTGISVEEYIHTWKEYYPDGRQYKGEEMPVARSLLHGEVIKGEELIVELEDGTLKWASAWSNPIRNSAGEIQGALLLFYDVTEKKDHENELIEAKNRADLANQAKSTFLANMSHELRTPLNGILGYAQILAKRDLDSDLVRGLSTIQASGEHLLALINDILDTAKIEAGKVILSPQSVRLDMFLETILTIIMPNAETKGLLVSLQTPNPLPDGVLVDPTCLRQVLLNLLNNGVKFTENGEVNLRVTCQDMGGQPTTFRLLFEVIDTGIGIDPDNIERIFSPFEQVVDQLRNTIGSGLGLYISKQLVELMGGKLSVYSEPGRGTTFTFEIAVPESTVESDHPSITPRTLTGFKGQTRRVLVVDDIIVNRAVLDGMLTPLGFEVVEAGDGNEAILEAQRTSPDLILMDRYMPVMDGLAAIVKLRQIPQLKSVPTLAVSASVAPEDRRKLLDAGFDDFVSKPVHWDQLCELLQQHLHLDWQYAEETEISRKVGVDICSLTPPPVEYLLSLQEKADIGDMQAIIAMANQIELMDVRYSAFARKLRDLAETFEDRQIQKLLRQFMETVQ